MAEGVDIMEIMQTKAENDQHTIRLKGIQNSMNSIYLGSEDDLAEKNSSESVLDIINCEKHKSNNKSKTISVYMSSDEYYEINCDACEVFGDYAEAEGFCADCNEYLCRTCFRSHSRSKVSKNHSLIDKVNMPKQSLNSVNSDDNQTVIRTKAEEIQTDEKCVYVKNVNVKSDNEKNCYITSIALISNNYVVLCDYENQILKRIDIDKNIILDSFYLENKPNGLTAISNDQVAIVLENTQQIHIISTSKEIALVRKIKTKGNCVNINMINKHLYVSFRGPVKFQMLKPTGEKIKTIKPDAEALKLCTLPLYFAVSLDESAIYVSDWETKNVFSLDMKGNVLSVYQGDLGQPMGIVISTCGFVYVCDRKRHIVYEMDLGLSETKAILGEDNGIHFPEAICVGTSKQHIYISSGSSEAIFCNALKIFKCKV